MPRAARVGAIRGQNKIELFRAAYDVHLSAPRLRALHASPDAPPVNVIVNGVQALANVQSMGRMVAPAFEPLLRGTPTE